MFDPVDPKASLPDLELGILKYWREEDTFKRSLTKREGGEVFSFYDGPPFATGLPHYGHLLAGTIKDVIPRYQAMRGKYVRRRFGWDCHGLPVENEIEKEQGLKSKKDIEALGVANFNALCRSAVQRYTKEWRATVERMGRWVDMDHDYRTMDPDFMESIWWVFKKLHTEGLIYEGHKPMHICPRCATPLSNFEVTLGYKDRTDMSTVATFPLVDDPKTVFLAWTTTTWSLPGNLWLGLGPEIAYVAVRQEKDDRTYIVSKKLADSVFKGKKYEIIGPIDQKKFVGKKYQPLFEYFVDTPMSSTLKKGKPQTFGEAAFDIILHPEVKEDEGTGIVHFANTNAEDGFLISKERGVDLLHYFGVDGRFFEAVKDFAGMELKPQGDPMATDKTIIEKLKKNGRYFKSYTLDHSYPHCWRCDSPLLNYATSSWFVAVEKIKEKMIGANAKTSWVPGHIRDGRFGKWLEGARDWAISRSRFWGTPLPIWRDPVTNAVEVIGSRDELVKKAPTRFTKIILARHAESEGNVALQYQGKEPGTSLTERGRSQATALASAVAGGSDLLPIAAVYYSPLDRTRQTAEAIAKATGAPLRVDPRIREVDFGEYEGKHIISDDLAFVRERRAHKFESGQVESIYHFQGMETWSNSVLRAGKFLDEVLPKHKGEAIVVVTHADLIMNLTHLFTGQDPQKIVHQPYPALGGMRTFYYDHERKAQMDLHKETVDEIVWSEGKKGKEKGKGVEITLVRHGETEMNKKGLVQGANTDLPLNKTGREQAKKTASGIEKKSYDLIVSSDLKRAMETATILSEETGIPLKGTSELLRERDLGIWSGQLGKELLQKLKAKKGVTGCAMLRANPEGGESFDQFIARTRKAHDFLLKNYAGKKILVVAHAGFIRALLFVSHQLTYEESLMHEPKNAGTVDLVLWSQMRRIDEVLDCWFESGSMPYAQEHFPFEAAKDIPPGFPAHFIAEGLDQTRGWFYTLMVLSAALFDCPAFRNCIVNGTVLAEDGKKMSKRLKNYPEPTEIVKKYGADAVRFALMSSPAVRAEDLRFSEKFVAESVRSVLLPLWNAYRLFVTYANAADYQPSLDFSLKNAESKHLLDRWIVLKTQELVNAMTNELDGYDLSATCAHLAASIDDLTNWYVRLSRRRLAGKEGDAAEALDTLYRVLLTNAQLLAPFTPFISEAIYLNLVSEEHGSIHFSDWPQFRELRTEDRETTTLMDNTRVVVTLGLSLRSDAKIRVRQPIQSVTFALPPSDKAGVIKELIKEELNVKQVIDAVDASTLGRAIVQVDARKVGPRLGASVQEIIKAGKAGDFEKKDGKILIGGEELSLDEAKIVYQSREGHTVAADHGIVVTIDTAETDALKLEGQARELIHAIQQLRKDAGLEFTDAIVLEVLGAEKIMEIHSALILEETRAELGTMKEKKQEVDIGGTKVNVGFAKKKEK